MIFRVKICSCLVACFLASLMPSITSAATIEVALTENTDGTYYKSSNALLSTFSGAVTHTPTAVDDTFFVTNTAAHYTVHGNNPTYTSATGSSSLIKFDLSVIPAGATIDEAVLQVFAHGGNTGTRPLGPIQHQTWGELKATAAGPDVVSPDLGWGAGANALWDFATDVNGTSSLVADGAGGPGLYTFEKFLFQDVTTDTQNFFAGTNYGWGWQSGNFAAQTSEGIDKERPVLFVQYTEADIPEPTSLLILTLGLGLIGCKGRRTRN